MTEDTVVIKSAPYIQPTTPNPMKAFSAEFYKNWKLQRNKIKNHPKYPYGLLREEMQEFMLDKLEFLIEQKLIKGIWGKWHRIYSYRPGSEFTEGHHSSDPEV